MKEDSGQARMTYLKMSTFLFYLLILFLPTQLGRHFWPDFSYIQGLRIDYLSPTIYGSDVLIFLLFITTILSFRAKSRRRRDEVEESYINQTVEKDPSTPSPLAGSVGMTKSRWLFLFFVLSSLFLVTLFALNPTLSFLKLLKILEMGFLGWFISQNLGKNVKLSTVILLLSITVFYESLLAIWQFLNQASVGGLWWFLGERTFNSSTPFIAQAVLKGQLILRPYGTFSHPNVLGGYLVVVLTLIISYFVIPSDSKRSEEESRDLFQNKSVEKDSSTRPAKRGSVGMTLIIISIFLGLVTLFLSFSRTAWVALGMGIFYLIGFAKQNLRMQTIPAQAGIHKNNNLYRFPIRSGMTGKIIIISILTTIFITSGVIFTRFLSLLDVDQKSFFIREQLNNVALKIISDYSLSGVGLNNFLIALPHYLSQTEAIRFYQPVHNIFLLIAAETGIIGLVFFLWFIFLTVCKILTTIRQLADQILLLLLLELLFLGLFDHYLWTLQQGQLLTALVFGLCWTKSVKIDK